MISGLPPYQINRRGLSRSFQVTNIFPSMTRVGEPALRRAVGRRLPLRVLEERRQAAGGARAHRADPRATSTSPRGATCRPALLTYAEQRALEIGITIAGGADVILLDEPTAGMSHAETERAVALIRRLTEGRTLLIVEHDMSVVFGLADRISVLVYGQIIATGTPEEIRGNPKVKEAYLGEEAALMLEVSDLHAYYGKSHILQGVDLESAPARSSACSAATASAAPPPSRPSWARCRRRARSGSRARDIAGLPSYQIAHLGLGYVPEHRDIFPGLTVRQNLMLGMKDPRKPGNGGWTTCSSCSPTSRARADTAAGVLSGGEKQMLTICRTLMGDPELIMIDEPTEGLAPLIVQQVGDLHRRDRPARRRHPAGRAEAVDRDADLAPRST